MYSKALLGYEQVYGSEHAEFKTLQDKLFALETVAKNKASVEIEERADNSQVEPSHLNV
jgi:hypothetical protein